MPSLNPSISMTIPCRLVGPGGGVCQARGTADWRHRTWARRDRRPTSCEARRCKAICRHDMAPKGPVCRWREQTSKGGPWDRCRLRGAHSRRPTVSAPWKTLCDTWGICACGGTVRRRRRDLQPGTGQAGGRYNEGGRAVGPGSRPSRVLDNAVEAFPVHRVAARDEACRLRHQLQHAVDERHSG